MSECGGSLLQATELIRRRLVAATLQARSLAPALNAGLLHAFNARRAALVMPPSSASSGSATLGELPSVCDNVSREAQLRRIVSS
jgi:hypothetical protein